MVLSVSDVRAIITKVCARTDVLDAFRKRDLGTVIAVLGAHGVTQGQISGLTGIPQGRLSEYMTRKRVPRASSTFQAFADGVGMPRPPVRRSAWLLIHRRNLRPSAASRQVGPSRTLA